MSFEILNRYPGLGACLRASTPEGMEGGLSGCAAKSPIVGSVYVMSTPSYEFLGMPAFTPDLPGMRDQLLRGAYSSLSLASS